MQLVYARDNGSVHSCKKTFGEYNVFSYEFSKRLQNSKQREAGLKHKSARFQVYAYLTHDFQRHFTLRE